NRLGDAALKVRWKLCPSEEFESSQSRIPRTHGVQQDWHGGGTERTQCVQARRFLPGIHRSRVFGKPCAGGFPLVSRSTAHPGMDSPGKESDPQTRNQKSWPSSVHNHVLCV